MKKRIISLALIVVMLLTTFLPCVGALTVKAATTEGHMVDFNGDNTLNTIDLVKLKKAEEDYHINVANYQDKYDVRRDEKINRFDVKWLHQAMFGLPYEEMIITYPLTYTDASMDDLQAYTEKGYRYATKINGSYETYTNKAPFRDVDMSIYKSFRFALKSTSNKWWEIFGSQEATSSSISGEGMAWKEILFVNEGSYFQAYLDINTANGWKNMQLPLDAKLSDIYMRFAETGEFYISEVRGILNDGDSIPMQIVADNFANMEGTEVFLERPYIAATKSTKVQSTWGQVYESFADVDLKQYKQILFYARKIRDTGANEAYFESDLLGDFIIQSNLWTEFKLVKDENDAWDIYVDGREPILNQNLTNLAECSAKYGDAEYYFSEVFAVPDLNSNGLVMDEDGYYLVNDYDDLMKVSENLNANYRLTADIDFAGHEMTNSGAIITGNFSGELDGQDYAIKNLTYKNNDQQSLFHEVSGTITNVSFENVTFEGWGDKPTTNGGAVIARYLLETGKICDVNVEVNFVASANKFSVETDFRDANKNYNSGMVQYLYGGTIEDCVITLKSSTNNSLTDGVVAVGANKWADGYNEYYGKQTTVSNVLVYIYNLDTDAIFVSPNTGWGDACIPILQSCRVETVPGFLWEEMIAISPWAYGKGVLSTDETECCTEKGYQYVTKYTTNTYNDFRMLTAVELSAYESVRFALKSDGQTYYQMKTADSEGNWTDGASADWIEIQLQRKENAFQLSINGVPKEGCVLPLDGNLSEVYMSYNAGGILYLTELRGTMAIEDKPLERRIAHNFDTSESITEANWVPTEKVNSSATGAQKVTKTWNPINQPLTDLLLAPYKHIMFYVRQANNQEGYLRIGETKNTNNVIEQDVTSWTEYKLEKTGNTWTLYVGGKSALTNLAIDNLSDLAILNYGSNTWYFSEVFGVLDPAYTGIVQDVDGYYLLDSYEDFMEIQNNPNKKYRLTADIDFAGHEMTSSGAIITGNFLGELDGQDYAIKNLTYKGNDQQSLFHEVSGTITNVSFENVTFEGWGDKPTTNGGAVIARYLLEPGKISDVDVEVNFVASANEFSVETDFSDANKNYNSGMVQYLYGGTIEDCVITLKSSTNNSLTDGVIAVGANKWASGYDEYYGKQATVTNVLVYTYNEDISKMFICPSVGWDKIPTLTNCRVLAATSRKILDSDKTPLYTVAYSSEDQFAAEEFALFMKEATGAIYTMDVATTAPSEEETKIVIGNDLATTANMDMSGLTTDNGFAITRRGNNIYVYGKTIQGTLNGVYALLNQAIGLKIYTEDCANFTYKSGEITLDKLNVVYNPGIDYLFDLNGETRNNETYRKRLGYELDYAIIGGLIHGESAFAESSYYTGEVTNRHITLNETHAKEVATWLYDQHILPNATKNQFVFGLNDDNEWYSDTTVGRTRTDEYVTFMNQVAAELQTKVSVEGRNVSLILLAYNQTTMAPSVALTSQDNVQLKVIYAPVQANWYKPLNDTLNDTVPIYDADGSTVLTTYDADAEFTAWSQKVASGNLILWTYHTFFDNYLTPLDCFNAMQKNFLLAASLNVGGILDNVQYDNGTATDWNRLKVYLRSELAKNPDMTEEEYEQLRVSFMDVYFGVAAESMKEALQEERVLLERVYTNIYNDIKSNLPNQFSLLYGGGKAAVMINLGAQQYEYWGISKFFGIYRNVYMKTKVYAAIKEAYADVEQAVADGLLTQTEAAVLTRRIKLESIAVRFILLRCPGNSDDSYDALLADCESLGITHIGEGKPININNLKNNDAE